MGRWAWLAAAVPLGSVSVMTGQGRGRGQRGGRLAGPTWQSWPLLLRGDQGTAASEGGFLQVFHFSPTFTLGLWV